MLFIYDRHKWLRVVILTLLAFALIECMLMAAVAITARTMDAPVQSDCIIVLGGGLNKQTGKPLSTLAYRLDRAKSLFDKGYARYIIVSGGLGSDKIISEAESMYNYLVEQSVPSSAIIMEDKSTNTSENMAYSKLIMDSHGFDSALIVTSDYHLWRALQLAERAGINACGAGARNSSTIFYMLKNLARETFSWIKFVIQD